MRSARKHLADKTHTSEIIQIKFTKKKELLSSRIL